MPTLLTHIRVKPEAIARWEEILQLMTAHTHDSEPDMLRYEYWRGQEAGLYYALLAYPTTDAFYRHQGSEYHDEFLDDFANMFADMRLEWVDPVAGGGSGLPPTENEPLSNAATEKVRSQVELYPIAIAAWWAAARRAGVEFQKKAG